jgi:hypothetical protein
MYVYEGAPSRRIRVRPGCDQEAGRFGIFRSGLPYGLFVAETECGPPGG